LPVAAVALRPYQYRGCTKLHKEAHCDCSVRFVILGDNAMTRLSRRQLLAALPVMAADWSLEKTPTHSKGTADAWAVFENVRIFDSSCGGLSPPRTVRMNTASYGIDLCSNPCFNATVPIAGAGRSLLPELIETHARAMLKVPSTSCLLLSEWAYLSVVGPCGVITGLGIVIVPRVWPSRAFCQPDSAARLTLGFQSISLSLPDYRILICDPRGPLALVSRSDVRLLNAAWGNCASVDSLTAHAVREEMARAGQLPDLGNPSISA
jgi:hypothetical protein